MLNINNIDLSKYNAIRHLKASYKHTDIHNGYEKIMHDYINDTEIKYWISLIVHCDCRYSHGYEFKPVCGNQYTINSVDDARYIIRDLAIKELYHIKRCNAFCSEKIIDYFLDLNQFRNIYDFLSKLNKSKESRTYYEMWFNYTSDNIKNMKGIPNTLADNVTLKMLLLDSTSFDYRKYMKKIELLGGVFDISRMNEVLNYGIIRYITIINNFNLREDINIWRKYALITPLLFRLDITDKEMADVVRGSQ